MIRTTASQAGLILLDRQGRPGYAHNTEHMLIGMCSQARGLRLALAPGKVA
jgi:isoaspartyl peptidase/L-asparaginase-like protein (Ntn-hydrolase superfamily)